MIRTSMILKQYTPSEDIYKEEKIKTRLCVVVHTLYHHRNKNDDFRRSIENQPVSNFIVIMI